MSSPDDVLDGVIESIKDNDELSCVSSFLKYEADTQGEDADIKLPLIQLKPIDVDFINQWNTDRVGYIVEENSIGEEFRTGEVYHNEYTMTVEIDLWVAAQSKYDVNELGTSLREWLYSHDNGSISLPVPNGNGEYIIEDEDGNRIRPNRVWGFEIETAERVDDTTFSPTIRRWRYVVDINAYEVYETGEKSPVREFTV